MIDKKTKEMKLAEIEKTAKKIAKIKTWNYRVIRKVDARWPDTPWFEIFEVYYDKSGVPHSWTAEPMQPIGETMPELRKDIKYMMEALKHPVLEEVVFRGKEKLVEWKPKEKDEIKPDTKTKKQKK